MSTDTPHRGWTSRGYLPHCDKPGLVQAITIRLIDALPSVVLQRWEPELSALPETARTAERRRRIEDWLDAGHGACWMHDPRIAGVVENALLHSDGTRYRLLGWAVMPNHVHVLAQVLEGWPLGKILYSWKSWTAKEANRLLQRTGAFWQREYHDRFIRDGRHLDAAIHYLEQNPVKAGLCQRAEDWPWGSARRRIEIPPSAIEMLSR